MKTRYGVIWMLAVVFLIGCAKIPKVERIDTVEIVSQTDTSLTIEIGLLVWNNNFFNVPVRKMDYTISIEGIEIGAGQNLEPFTLKSKAPTVCRLITEVDLAAVSQIYTVVLTQDSSEIAVEGDYTFHLLWKDWSVHNRTAKKFKLSQEIQNALINSAGGTDIRLHKVYLPTITPTQTTFHIDLSIAHEQPITYTLDSLDLKLYKSDTEQQWLKGWNLPESKIIQAGQTEIISVSFTVGNFELLKALPNTLLGGSWNFHLKGFAYISIAGGSFAVPISYEIPISSLPSPAGISLPRLGL